MCEHLLPLEKHLQAQGIPETFRGQAWSTNCREWVYFDCYLDISSLQEKFGFPAFVKHHVNNDPRSGLEEGFVCYECHDAIIGLHNAHRTNDARPVIR